MPLCCKANRYNLISIPLGAIKAAYLMKFLAPQNHFNGAIKAEIAIIAAIIADNISIPLGAIKAGACLVFIQATNYFNSSWCD